MNKWQPATTIPHYEYVLVYLDFSDDTDKDVPGMRICRWETNLQGFNLVEPDDGVSWNIRGLKAWMYLPEPPALQNIGYYNESDE